MPVPTEDELREFIEDPLRAKLEANRSIRRRQSRRTRIFTTTYLLLSLTVTCAVTMALGIGADDGFWATYWGSFALVGGWIGLYVLIWHRHIAEELPFDYRDEVVAPVVHYLDPRLDYRPGGVFSAGDLEEAGLFDEVDDLRGGEGFSGTVGGIELRFGAVVVPGSRWPPWAMSDRFRGLVAVADYPIDVDGEVLLVARPGDREAGEHPAVDGWVPVGDAAGEVSEESAFGGDFEIWTDRHANFEALSHPEIVDRLRELRRQSVDDGEAHSTPPVALLMRDATLYIAIPADDFFDASPSCDDVDTTHLHRVGHQLRLVIDIVESLGAALSSGPSSR